MLNQAAVIQLTRLQSFLSQIREDDYKMPLPVLQDGTLGKHVRHVIEFFQCLFNGNSENLINYDNRKRNTLIENNVAHASQHIDDIIETLNSITYDKPIQFVAAYREHNIEMTSSLYREITFTIEHAVHHMAIIRIACTVHFNYILLPENFGYADSTIRHFNSQETSR